MRWARHVTCIKERRIAYKVLVGKPEGKTPLGRRRCMWENTIKMDLKEIGWEGVNWINLNENRDQ
jgi:hypothetical protein